MQAQRDAEDALYPPLLGKSRPATGAEGGGGPSTNGSAVPMKSWAAIASVKDTPLKQECSHEKSDDYSVESTEANHRDRHNTSRRRKTIDDKQSSDEEESGDEGDEEEYSGEYLCLRY